MNKRFKNALVTLLLLGIWLVVGVFWIGNQTNEGWLTITPTTWVSLEITTWAMADIVELVYDMIETSTQAWTEALIETSVVLEEIVEPVVEQETYVNWLFADQPQDAPYEYGANTVQLNAYAHANPVEIYVPEDATQMIVVLKKSIDINMERPRIILYREKEAYQCWGRLYLDYNQTRFAIPLNNVAMDTKCPIDWTKLRGKTIRLAWYVPSYDWNKIMNIIFN